MAPGILLFHNRVTRLYQSGRWEEEGTWALLTSRWGPVVCMWPSTWKRNEHAQLRVSWHMPQGLHAPPVKRVPRMLVLTPRSTGSGFSYR